MSYEPVLLDRDWQSRSDVPLHSRGARGALTSRNNAKGSQRGMHGQGHSFNVVTGQMMLTISTGEYSFPQGVTGLSAECEGSRVVVRLTRAENDVTAVFGFGKRALLLEQMGAWLHRCAGPGSALTLATARSGRSQFAITKRQRASIWNSDVADRPIETEDHEERGATDEPAATSSPTASAQLGTMGTDLSPGPQQKSRGRAARE